MKFASYIKYPLELSLDQGLLLKHIFIRDCYVDMLKRSLYGSTYKVRTGLDGEDFVNELRTMVFSCKCYRISRIIKKLKMKQLTSNSQGTHSSKALRS